MEKSSIDFSDKKVLCPISGGINSAVVLIGLCIMPKAYKPIETHLYYVHFDEHSEDTLAFVYDLFAFAKNNLKHVFTKIDRVSVLEFFEKQKFIPHPTISPCSKKLKIEPMEAYYEENNLDVDLVGYVREEKRRYNNSLNYKQKTNKEYPLLTISNEKCFEIVKHYIGWYPKIYDILDDKGKRVFTHNNCLPCKNMTEKQLSNTEKYFPEKYREAINLCNKIGSYFGRLPVINKCNYCEFD